VATQPPGHDIPPLELLALLALLDALPLALLDAAAPPFALVVVPSPVVVAGPAPPVPV
jgi:hypothetical protein